jgi:hypothetical protein
MMRTAGLDDGSPSTTLTRLELKASMIETSSRVIALVLCLRQRRKCRPGSSALGRASLAWLCEILASIRNFNSELN